MNYFALHEKLSLHALYPVQVHLHPSIDYQCLPRCSPPYLPRRRSPTGYFIEPRQELPADEARSSDLAVHHPSLGNTTMLPSLRRRLGQEGEAAAPQNTAWKGILESCFPLQHFDESLISHPICLERSHQ